MLSAGVHTALVVDAFGCTELAQINIGSPPPLALQAWVPDTVCANMPQVLSAIASGGQGPLSISWGSLGTGSPLTASFAEDQQVIVTVSDSLGCTGPVLSYMVSVLDLDAAQLVVSPDAVVCPGNTATVSAGLNGYQGAYTIYWPGLGQTGSGPFTIPVPQTMIVPVIVQDVCGATIADTIHIQLDTPPDIVLPDVIAEGCAPLTVQFPTGLTDQDVSYLWSLGNGLFSTQAAPVVTYSAGNYTVGLVVTTAAGCTASATGAGGIISHSGPQAAFMASPWQTDINSPTISFSDQSSGNIVQWEWDLGEGATASAANCEHTYSDIGVFPVQLWVEDGNGCIGTVMNYVTITPDHDITVPNVFTPDPNGGSGGTYDPADLSNDVFYPFLRFVETFQMRVFNRWGELVFESDDVHRGWDGYYRGQLSPQDVYVYQINVRFVDGKEAMRMGDLTLLR